MSGSFHYLPTMLEEFKKFAFKGNLVDMAVGIIIGGAFGTVVKSLVDDIFMPIIGMITGGVDFSDRFAILKRPEGAEEATYATAEAATEAGATVMTWGNFVTAFISFIILAFVLFIVIKKFMAALQREEEKPPAEAKVSKEVELLTEIRDHLAKQS